jgi:hypothetical protein
MPEAERLEGMRKLTVFVLASLALSACGGTETADPGATAEPEAAGVGIRQIYDVSKGMYVEGGTPTSASKT